MASKTGVGGIATGLAAGLWTALAAASPAAAEELLGVKCESPPPMHCAEGNCAALMAEPGNVVEPTSGRRFFLDYPCDLKPGEPVVFVLNLHGGGSIGNWQRHYFPAMDHKEKRRLVVATPTAATSQPMRIWTAAADDAYLQAVSELVLNALGRDRVRSFWLAGHSQGGMTSNRIVCNDYFAPRVDGWLSLSGGRIGPAELSPTFFGPSGGPPRPVDVSQASGGTGARPGAAVAPACDLHFIFTTGDLEIAGLPETSPWAEKYGCAARVRREDVVDERPGWVTGARPGDPNPAWGRAARPGTAEVFVYPNCRDGRLVADVVRLDKGHTEGLEPQVTDALLEMMAAAPGGKLQRVQVR